MRLVRITGAGTGLILEVGHQLHVIDIVATEPALRSEAPETARGIHALFQDPGQSWLPMISNWADARETLRKLAAIAMDDIRQDRTRLPIHTYEELPLDPPIPDPGSRIFAMGGNFPAHTSTMGTQMDLPDSVLNGDAGNTPPWGFYVIPGTIVGTEATITPPAGTRYLDYEAEVAVVLGAGNHQPGRTAACIWGYTAWNDFSIRDTALGVSQTDHGPLTWSLTKNFRTGNSCGPWMVVDHPAVDNLSISCSVNQEVRQRGNTSQMKYSFGRIAAHVSTYIPIGSGDMILSGTPGGTAVESGPGGPFLRNGDHVTVSVDGIDVLTNRICFTG
ncbi:fumarylacetoacetate hydrolase family protein [Mycobacterium sp. pUA109]|uniref:fumarylacetoacetate hydrolase family protein n=1 Tax=Mycobacterium sp. pUA109 TaxID=3238982 RepID=UPI00351BA2DC